MDVIVSRRLLRNSAAWPHENTVLVNDFREFQGIAEGVGSVIFLGGIVSIVAIARVVGCCRYFIQFAIFA
jgi:hypothetical protein